MGQYDFTYEVPANFQQVLIRFMQQNGNANIAKTMHTCKLDYNDVGLAYYAGLRGDNWNKRALDFIIEGSEKNIAELRRYKDSLENAIQTMLRPNTTGFLIRNIDFIISDDEYIPELPQDEGEKFEILAQDIYDALGKGEPVLVLDRLHTYSTRFLRNLCQKHNIPIENNGDYYPLHSLVGTLAKYYKENGIFESEFVEQAVKMSISTFEKYNGVRNNQSYAHDNDVLNKNEATYVVSVVTATLNLLNEIEN